VTGVTSRANEGSGFAPIKPENGTDIYDIEDGNGIVPHVGIAECG